ncbi:MAG TPA: HPF/RaiA family ribosome-associated protein [Paracoccaceae bacterium]|nr:HPF/RaiA family ribosome-associated protein [Paracoccaceae bacterium]
MQSGVEIAYHHMEPNRRVERRVHERVARLEKFFGRLTACRVVIDAPHQHHRSGNHYEVRLEAHAPTGTFVIDRVPGDVNAHHDVLVAIRDAFDAMERKIRRWKEQHSGRPEHHVEPLQGRIAELHPERDFGQIAMTDGQLVYFHRNAVVEGAFESLAEGDTVEVVLAEGDSARGPHASTVRPVSPLRFADRPR